MAEPMILNPSDNVAILTERGVAPAGHKIARRAIATGEPVFKYGQIIGYATADISAGDHVHSHNCAFGDHDRAHRPGAGLPAARAALDRYRGPALTFQGYHREGGQIGTRNFIAIVGASNCAAFATQKIADAFDGEARLE